MGVVYRATDTRLDRQVALKVPPEYGDDPAFRARFLGESRIAGSIDHPGVVPIYEAGEGDGQQLYIAMRFVEGTDLAALLRSEGALGPERALSLAGQLAAALDAAHERGLVHRDVKPSNAMVAPAGDVEHVYLCDFGLSKEAAGDATLSASGGFVGTVKYMVDEAAPERSLPIHVDVGGACPRDSTFTLDAKPVDATHARRCAFDLAPTEPGMHELVMSTGGDRVTAEIDLRDHLVVSIGDSVASGEGNPDAPGRRGWRGAATARCAPAPRSPHARSSSAIATVRSASCRSPAPARRSPTGS
jgi:serine/threonine protein kinase